MRSADRMDRREIDDVKPHGAHGRKPADDVLKRAMTSGLPRRGAREHLVPRADPSLRPFDLNRNCGFVPDEKMACRSAAHRLLRLLCQQPGARRHLLRQAASEKVSQRDFVWSFGAIASSMRWRTSSSSEPQSRPASDLTATSWQRLA